MFEGKGIKYRSAFIYVQTAMQNKVFKRANA